MTDYVLATDADDVERRRMSLLFAYHGALTIEVLEAAGVSRGRRCLEIGAGGGEITRWLVSRVVPGGSVVAVDLHLPNLAEACRRCVALTAPGGQIVIHDAASGLSRLPTPLRQKQRALRSCAM